MSRTVTVVTPENITVTYQAAGVASRFLAAIVDLIAKALLIVGASALFNLLASGGDFGFGALFTAANTIVVYLIFVAYELIFEAVWDGRTPGKRLFGLRVIREGGYPITFLASAIRNLLRFLDYGIIPFGSSPLILCGLPGLVTIFFSPTYKRFGDYAAGTLVIMEARSGVLESEAAANAYNVQTLLPYVRNLDRLSTEEYRLLRRFVTRRKELETAAQAALGERIARPLMTKLGLEVPIYYQIQYADLLEAIERRYAEERGVL